MEPKHILFPVDFSDNCTAVADYVEAMARGSGAYLTLLHVLECRRHGIATGRLLVCPPSSISDRSKNAGKSSSIDISRVNSVTSRQCALNRKATQQARLCSML
jgi:Universal stress protein family